MIILKNSEVSLSPSSVASLVRSSYEYISLLSTVEDMFQGSKNLN